MSRHTDGAGGGRPPGTELELRFGWPACYQVELWRSDDVQVLSRVLEMAPFDYPTDEMSLVVRHVGRWAIVLDALFAVLAMTLIAILFGRPHKQWKPARTLCAMAVGVALVLLVLIGTPLSVHL